MKRIAVIGSGDLGMQLAHLAGLCGFDFAGFYDDFALEKDGVLGDVDRITSDFESKVFDGLVVGVGYKHMDFRQAVFDRFKGKIPFANLIHPSSFVDSSTDLGEGVVIYAGSVVDAQSTLGDNVLLNCAVTVAHDTQIGSHSFLSPRVALAGFVHVGSRSVLGINSTVIDNITLCDGTRLGAGAVLLSHTTKPGLYVGVPCQWKKD